jgi:transposase
MEVRYACGGGINGHAKMWVACLLKPGKKELRTFSTMTEDLLRLRDWLTRAGCPHGALESTGGSWRPVFNLREGTLAVILTNARDAKGYKARKTDVIDAEWLADRLRHGVLQPSFIPPLPIRALRELPRCRESLVREQTALANRIQQLIESANIKLGQVASDARGVSGKLRLRALAAGETDAEKRSHLARCTLKRKQPQFQQALEGRFTDAQRWIVSQLLDQYDQVAAALQRAEERLKQEVESSADPFVPEAVQLLDTSPGVGETVAQSMVAEIGVAMDRLPTAKHLASWAGMCPGNNESAGKRKSGKTTQGSRYLRAALVQAAWAARHQKGTYRAAQYKRWVKRRGKKKALGAGGHSILVIAYHVLQTRTSYQDLGGDYFDRRNIDKQRQRLIRQLEALGVQVTVEEVKEAV